MKQEQTAPSHTIKTGAWMAHQQGYYGNGIGIAILDTGVSPHPDFFIKGKRIREFSDFINYKNRPYDDANHGTHICGIIASGRKDKFGHYYGIAPESHLVCGKVLDAKGNGKIHTSLAAFQWICRIRHQHNIRIINISMGMPVRSPEDEFSPFMEAVDELWKEGFVIVAAAGNNGPGSKTITAPGISRKIITVGSCEDNFSGQGPTINCVKKPDLCAPGKNICSCGNRGNSYIYKSGTSMSTPMVSAAAALLLSKEPSLTNKEVKKRLLASARNLGLPWQQQGAGMLDIKTLLNL